MKKVLVVTHYFWPENFKINSICQELIKRGYGVSVLTGKPNYPVGSFNKGYNFLNKNTEMWKNIKIYRTPVFNRGSGSPFRLIINWLSFGIFGVIRSLFIKEKFDKIFVYQPSPFTVAIPALFLKYRYNAKVFFWVQDIWPETLTAAGGIRNKVILSIISSFVKFTYNRCEMILVQSKAFISNIRKFGVDNNKIMYFPNSTEEFYKPIKKDKHIDKLLPDGPKLIFAGNIGEAQSFDTLINSALIVKEKGHKINWIILGDGRKRKYAEKKCKELGLHNNFIFLGAFPSEMMPNYFSCADALIVSLKNQPIFHLTIPNKVQSYLACGKPIIASLSGEGAKCIDESESGFVAEPENEIILAKKIIDFLLLNKNEKKKLGLNARKYYLKQFDLNILIEKLLKIFEND